MVLHANLTKQKHYSMEDLKAKLAKFANLVDFAHGRKSLAAAVPEFQTLMDNLDDTKAKLDELIQKYPWLRSVMTDPTMSLTEMSSIEVPISRRDLELAEEDKKLEKQLTVMESALRKKH